MQQGTCKDSWLINPETLYPVSKSLGPMFLLRKESRPLLCFKHAERRLERISFPIPLQASWRSPSSPWVELGNLLLISLTYQHHSFWGAPVVKISSVVITSVLLLKLANDWRRLYNWRVSPSIFLGWSWSLPPEISSARILLTIPQTC